MLAVGHFACKPKPMACVASSAKRLRREESIAALCRREGIPSNLYYRWSKEFLEAGKKRLAGDTKREATSKSAI